MPPAWQQAACALLKTAHLVKSVEGRRLDDLYGYDWERPAHVAGASRRGGP